jgi:hypothetical protein
VTQLHKKLQLQQDRADDLQRQYMETKGMLESESSRTTDLEKILASKAVDGDRDRAALARAEEELSRTRREAEKAEKALAKLKAATNSAAASGTTAVDPELQEERDKLYVSPVLRQLFRSGPGSQSSLLARSLSFAARPAPCACGPTASPSACTVSLWLHPLRLSAQANGWILPASSLLQGLHRLAHHDTPAQVPGL